MWGKRIAPQQKKLLPFLPGSLLKGKLCFYAAQRQCQETNCWQFWRKVLSLHRVRITCNASWDGSGWHKIVVDRRARQVWITLTVRKKKIALQESLQNNNKTTATVLNKDMQPTHLCVYHFFSIYQTYGKFIFCTTHGSSCNFPLFWFVEVKQKIIIRNNNLLFKIRWPYYIPAGSKTIKKYALGQYFVTSFFAIISSKFFGLSDNSGLVYTPRQQHLIFS